MTNRDKVNALSNREMAVLWDYIKSDCAGSNCVFNACPDCGGDCMKGFEAWLGLECEAEENPPADKHVDLQKVSARKIKELADRGVITMAKCKPEMVEEYYIPEIIDGKPDMFITVWNDDDIDHKRYEAGVVFTDKYDAIIVAKKMLDMVKEIADEKREL